MSQNPKDLAQPRANAFVPTVDEIIAIMQDNARDAYGEGSHEWPAQLDVSQAGLVQAHLNAIGDLMQTFQPPQFEPLDE